MRVPLSWLRELVAIPDGETGRDVAERLVRAGLEVETVETVGGDVTGPLVVGRVGSVEVLTEFKKPIRWCQVDVGESNGGVRGIICGAANFVAGDLVAVALPGAVLPGGFAITARQTYGRVSDGMICSERELGLGDDHDGIIVLPPGTAEVGVDAGPVLGLGDEVLDIAVTPDRGYCLSMRGIAREAAVAYEVDVVDPVDSLADLPAPQPGGVPHPCGSEDLDATDLFTLRTIVGFDPHAATPWWMRRRLSMCGMRSVSLAVDVTNYVMLELGQPLHAFDLTKLRGPVVARRARPGERLETLDHVVRDLHPDDVVISDDRGAVGLAGTMGGLETEIDDDSTDLALEAAHFAPTAVARMSRRHKLSSEASRRFERGVDRELAPYASARAAALLLALGGGRYLGMTAVEAPYEPARLHITADLPSRVSGADIPAEETIGWLRAVGCQVTVDGSHLHVVAPSWRPDLTDPYDLVEEVVRLHGYESLPATLPAARPGFGLTADQRRRRALGHALAGAGYVEVLTYPFVGTSELEALAFPPHDRRWRLPRLANPLSDEAPFLRGTLLPGLLAALRRNVGRGSSDLALFECGAVSRLREGQEPTGVGEPPRPSVMRRPDDDAVAVLESLLPDQPRHVAVALCGQRSPGGWWGEAVPAGWADAVEAARVVAAAVRAPLDVRRGDNPPWHPGRCAELVSDGEVVGHAGELHPRVIAAMGLPSRTAVMELDLDALSRHAADVVPAPEVGTFPVAKEDVALVLPDDVPAAAVEAALREGAGELLESVRLFDVYTGSQVPPGHKSLAFALRFRAGDRTLTVEESTAARAAAVAAAAERFGAVQRA